MTLKKNVKQAKIEVLGLLSSTYSKCKPDQNHVIIENSALQSVFQVFNYLTIIKKNNSSLG